MIDTTLSGKRLAIFGGTGKTGQLLVTQALEAGYEVVVLARTPSKIAIQHPHLNVVQGDILDVASVETVVQGVDAVLCMLHPADNKPTFTISSGMQHILNAMKMHNVRRIIISAGAGVRDPLDRPNLVDRFFGLLLNLFAKNVVADMARVVDLVRHSELDWTVVRVPVLVDQPRQPNLKVGYVGDITPRVSRADLAAFMLGQVEDTSHLRQAPAISN